MITTAGDHKIRGPSVPAIRKTAGNAAMTMVITRISRHIGARANLIDGAAVSIGSQPALFPGIEAVIVAQGHDLPGPEFDDLREPGAQLRSRPQRPRVARRPAPPLGFDGYQAATGDDFEQLELLLGHERLPALGGLLHGLEVAASASRRETVGELLLGDLGREPAGPVEPGRALREGGVVSADDAEVPGFF